MYLSHGYVNLKVVVFFITNFGHNESTFWNPGVIKHCLDGLQYALGDLAADATPTSKIKRTTVLAPAKP